MQLLTAVHCNYAQYCTLMGVVCMYIVFPFTKYLSVCPIPLYYISFEIFHFCRKYVSNEMKKEFPPARGTAGQSGHMDPGAHTRTPFCCWFNSFSLSYHLEYRRNILDNFN